MDIEDFVSTLTSIGLWEEVNTYTNPEKADYMQRLLLQKGIINIAVGRVSGSKRVIVIAVPVVDVNNAKGILGVRKQKNDLGAYSWYED